MLLLSVGPLAQVLLQWSVAQGFVPIFGTTNPAHLRSNFGALRLTLHPEDVERLTALGACPLEHARRTGE